MTAPKLTKLGGDGNYLLKGTTAGLIGPGRRRIVDLTIRGIGEGTSEDLSPLHAFPDLARLELDDAADLDLTPLTGLDLRQLRLNRLRGSDLAPIGGLRHLETLAMTDLSACDTTGLQLPESLDFLSLGITEPAGATSMMTAFIENTNWSQLKRLRVLSLYVQREASKGPLGVDLGFLRCLPELITLRLDRGLVHYGAGPSPLNPPFDGLPPRLTRVRFESADPDPITRALTAHLPAGSEIAITQRIGADDSSQAWAITAPASPNDPWLTYGRLHSGESDDTEYDACERAERAVRRADPELADRLEFDPEADGTGIEAVSREDLERALDILNVKP